MKKNLFKICLALTTFSFASCATIFTGTKDTLTFNSTPSGADVYKDGIKICTTPCTIPVKRSINSVDIELKLDGYQTKVITLDKKFNAVSLVNIIGGALIGFGVDAITGSINKYDKKTYDVELEQKTIALLKQAKKINIDTKNKVVEVYVIK